MRKSIFYLVACTIITLHSFSQITTSSRWILKKGGLFGPTYYGTQGVTSPLNNPNSYYQDGYVSWKDNVGNFWIFGCDGYNDLWKFEPSTNNWTWMKGSHTINDIGEYGIKGVPSPENNPPGRSSAMGWVDNDGNLWLFGGGGYTFNGAGGLNDLWKYDPATNNWTWMNGDNAPNQNDVYGTVGLPSENNKPGSRSYAMTWTDLEGNFWLFGGSTTGFGLINNDLWKYDPSINQWTCMQTPGPIGYTYDRPSRRRGSTSITDRDGNFWLFGGFGSAIDFSSGASLNDLWKYDLSTGIWIWVKGSGSGFTVSNYGVQGISSPTNTPGVRQIAGSWSDTAGNIWIFGGYGVGTVYSDQGYFNDLWKFDPSSNNWTWMLGDTLADRPHFYAQFPCEQDIMGSRALVSTWKDADGSFWLFGGHSTWAFQDMWKLEPSGPLPPGITSLSRDPVTIWPPNHTMKDITVSYNTCNSVNCQITVTSNEPQNGLGDGDQSPDWEIIDDHHIKLRAERSQNGTGRVYTIKVTCQNSAGVSTNATTTVTVTDNNSPSTVAIPGVSEIQISREQSDLTAYPNPSKNYFTVNFDNKLSGKITLTVFDINGRVIEKRLINTAQNVQLGQLYRPGVYVVELQQGNFKKQMKIVKM